MNAYIVSTGFPDTNLAVMYNRLGALGHFIKPIDRHIAMFWTTLESALNDERRSIHTGIEQLKKLTATRQDEVVKTNIGIHTAARDKYGLLQTCADWLELLANGEQYERLDSAVTDLRSLLRQRSISLHDYFYLLEGMQIYAYDSPVIRKILSDEYQNIAFRETDEASVENRSVEPFVEEIIHALHVFDSTVAPEVAEYIRSKLQSPSTLSAREDLGTSEWDSDLDLSDLTIGIAGGHHKTRANIVERLLKLGVASCIEVAPSSESYLSKSKVAEAIRDCDLVGFITGYTGHDLSYILVSLNRTGAFRGRLMRLSCRGVSGVVRELTAKLQQMF